MSSLAIYANTFSNIVNQINQANLCSKDYFRFSFVAHETTAGCLAFTLFEILSNEKIYQRYYFQKNYSPK